MTKSPVQGGVRKRRTRAPSMTGTGDATQLAYSALGSTVSTLAPGYGGTIRAYIPGLTFGLTNSIGPNIVGYYSSAKFLPGTKIRWEPSVSFTTSGRVSVGFTDNPEAIVTLSTLWNTATSSGLAADWLAYANAIKGLGSMRSFPVWQETEIEFPTKLRRKMFDTNLVPALNVDVYDRSCQTAMFAVVEGATNVFAGSFWYHDKLAVEGIQNTQT